ncbi:MAG TPA: septation protein A [Chitinivibrionales bacterium]|nr:septation protein A [Chitinivibrionales bacterium]
MKLLFDLLPVILFFAAFKLKGIFVATGVAIAASVLQIGWMLVRRKKVDPMMWASLGIIAVFGGATIILHNETYIKWKPTILYWLMSAVLVGGQMFFKKNGMKGLLGKQMILPDKAWTAVNLSWGIFFAVIGCANLIVAYAFSTDTWVNFKLFGIMGCIFAFAIVQSLILGSKQVGGKVEGEGKGD